MNTHCLIPLIATIAYIPLFAILISNRPWQRQRRLFVWFLIAAILWSLSDFLLRSDFFMPHKLLLSKIVVCIFTLAAAQFHCFISLSYPQNKGRWLPLAYSSVAIAVALAVLGYIPEGIVIADGVLYIRHGNGVFLMGLPLAVVTVRNIYFFAAKNQDFR